MPFRPLLPYPRKLLVVAFALLADALTAATNAGASPATLQRDGTGNLVFHWSGETGKRYFLETSTDLVTWSWMPDAFTGAGTDLATTVIAAGNTCTVRMKAFNLDGSFLGELDTFQIVKSAK